MEISKKDKEEKQIVDLSGYTPLNGRILIRQNPAPVFTKAGIEIPENKREKPNTGEVLKLSEKIDEDIKVGDKLLFRRGGGFNLTIKGEEYLMIHEAEAFLKYTQNEEDPNK